MVFRYYRLKEKKEREILMHSEQAKRELLKMEALRGQLNPHFIFNSLNSVNDFILDNDPLRANQYLTDFSSLMRAFLDNSKNEFIPLIKEIELLEHYLKLEQTRFSDKFRYEIDIDQIENIYVEITPSMIQPFVENAVWHGIGKMQNNKPGIIKLLFKSCERKCVICQVEDNGIGIEKANAMKSHQQKKRQSRGTGIIKERLDIFNGMHNTNFTIRFEEIDPGIENPGTRAIIEIPIKESEPSSESPRKSEGLQPE
jgi:LytS/YehU family sensor histidine kinase